MSLLMWSGGCDSTLVLAEHIKTGMPIRTVGVTHNNIHSSHHLRKVRERIMAWYGSVNWPHSEIEVGHGDRYDVDAYPCREGLSHPGVWLSIACQYLEKDEDLILAYIRGDDVWHYIGWLHHAFDGLQGVSKKTGKLLFPAEWTSKAEVIADIKKFPGLYDLVWWCEDPQTTIPTKKKGVKTEPCGRCHPCRTHAAALHEVEEAAL